MRASSRLTVGCDVASDSAAAVTLPALITARKTSTWRWVSGGRAGSGCTAEESTAPALALVAEHGIPVNAGSVDMIDQLAAALGPRARGHRVWLRINPGFGHGHSRKTNTGGEHSKHGIWP